MIEIETHKNLLFLVTDFLWVTFKKQDDIPYIWLLSSTIFFRMEK